MVTVPRKTLERNLCAEGHRTIIGVDEVGMACLAGPVVVCALAVDAGFYERAHRELSKLRDSKALLPHQRERYADALVRESGLRWHIGVRDPAVIDEVNIYQASRDAMREAVQALASVSPTPVVLVDGNKILRGIDLPQRAVVKGDRKIWAIAAASILAKVHRDRMMAVYAHEYPLYAFEQHKGYPTRLHYARLREHGPCPLHRRSFLRNLTKAV
ncbi:MAG: ribonuclease HII [Candidatus Yanofskybacteria bacterium]|nr:ribonuclease HII [Candidatus Yanofskybacteria bacterium]